MNQRLERLVERAEQELYRTHPDDMGDGLRARIQELLWEVRNVIVGYRHIQTQAFLCVPCAYAEEWELDDSEHIDVILSRDMQATLPCPRCSLPLKQANQLVRCQQCGHLRTRGGVQCEEDIPWDTSSVAENQLALIKER